MINNINSTDWEVGNPQLTIKNKIDFEQTGINMMIRIWAISSKVTDTNVEIKLNKILTADSNLNGFIWATFRNRDWLELCCYISTESSHTIPTTFFEHYSRLLTEVSLFPPKTREDVFNEIIKIGIELNSYQES
ncbi:MAG: hypothetical protein Q8L07_15035 [Sediminibacterium sp.]|nr:hypothetical protein [Sediminibacterium sp.]